MLARELVRAPAGRIELVVADNLDYSNGFAQPFPRNRIQIYAQPPASEPTLAHHDDWLQLLLLHELTHVFHFDYAGGVWEPLRGIFGRNPLLFPQIFSPGWVVEGLATYFESAYTGAGRVRGSQFEMMVRTAILENAFFAIDEATLDPVTWPAGNTRYLYGSFFIDHLARRFGPDAVSDYIRRTGTALIPYRPEAAARRAFGTTLGREWEVWQDSLRARYHALADSLAATGLTEPELLTPEGRYAFHPRHSPDGSRIVYSASTWREDPAHRILDASDGRVLADLDRTSLGRPAWLPDGSGLLIGRLEFDDPFHLRSDVYVSDLDGDEHRVTGNARVWEPDPNPDGRRAVAVRGVEGTNTLALVDLSTGAVRPLSEPRLDEYWSSPRWSPDGTRIAAMRWMEAGRFDVVIVDTLGRDLRRVTDDASADLDPAWSPDGRYVLFSSDRTGIPNLFAFDVRDGSVWQVTNVLTGAFMPDVSPDGRSIVFVWYRADGYHLARIPFDPGAWRPAPPADAPPGEGFDPGPAGANVAAAPVRPYSAFPSVLPTSWLPAVGEGEEVGLGIGLAGEDAVQRHLWAAEALVYPEDFRVEWGAAYRFQGWGVPTLDLETEQRWAVENRLGDGGERLRRRDREAAIALSWLHRRYRSAAWLQGGVDLDEVVYFGTDETVPDPSVPLDLGASVGLGYSNARSFGLSLGPQAGVSLATRVEGRRYLGDPGAGVGRDYWRVTGRSRAYRALDWFGFAPPTLALRLDGGVQTSDATTGFVLGGASGQTSGLLIDSWLAGASATYPLRGFEPGVQRGSRIATATAEYRFPIWLVERGLGLFPLALDRLWGDLFVDAGAAWCPGPCNLIVAHDSPDSPDPLFSFGAEAVVELRIGYVGTLPLRFGVALPTRDPGAYEPVGYVRIGRSF